MASTTYGSPYVQSSDLVSAWPTASLSVADRIDDVSFKGNGLNNQTASYTGVLTDAGKTVMMNVATANTFTIPASGAVAYELGTVLRVSNKGAGTTTVQPNGGVTLNGGNISLTQYQSCEVQLVATDIWVATVKPQTVTSSGLTLITSTTFSAVSTVNVNNCFSASYENYRIIWVAAQSASTRPLIRLRVSGTDATGSDYQYNFGDITSGVISANTGTTTSFVTVGSNSTAPTTIVMDVLKPAVAATTYVTPMSNDGAGGSRFGSYRHTVSTAYDGISFYPESSGTMTGTIRVYGYQNS